MNVHSLQIYFMTLTQPASDKRGAILCATLKLLSSHGFHGFSIKQVAAEAGVAAGTIYLYFSDREALIRELHTEIISDFVNAALNDLDTTASLQQQYRSICCNIWRFCLDNPCITHSKLQFDHLPPDVLRCHRSYAWEIFQPLKTLLNQGREQGLIKPLADDVLITLSIEPCIFMARQHLLGVIEVDTRQLGNIISASWDAIATHGTPSQTPTTSA